MLSAGIQINIICERFYSAEIYLVPIHWWVISIAVVTLMNSLTGGVTEQSMKWQCFIERSIEHVGSTATMAVIYG